MNSALKSKELLFKTRNCVSKTRNFAFKMMTFAETDDEGTGEVELDEFKAAAAKLDLPVSKDDDLFYQKRGISHGK